MNAAATSRTASGPPELRCGVGRSWGAISAQRLSAPPGRHVIQPRPVHRLVFYRSGGVATECGCETLRRTRTVAPGTFDLVPAGAAAFWDDAAPVDFVVVRLTPDLLKSTAEALALRGAVSLSPQIGAQDSVIARVALALDAELDAVRPAARAYTDGLGVALAARLLHGFRDLGAPRRRSLSKPQMRRLLAFIEDHLGEDLPLRRMAEALDISVPHLTSLFRRTTGQTVHRYVMERRVQRARGLLAQGRLSVAEVASECGFAHQSHLARWTRRILCANPRDLQQAGRPRRSTMNQSPSAPCAGSGDQGQPR